MIFHNHFNSLRFVLEFPSFKKSKGHASVVNEGFAMTYLVRFSIFPTIFDPFERKCTHNSEIIKHLWDSKFDMDEFQSESGVCEGR